jgi:YHS domain-containing protein
MNRHRMGIALAVLGVLTPMAVSAQHEGHQAAAPQPSAYLAQCAQVQPAVDNIIVAATARLETARQSNDPAHLRAAVDHLQGALRDLRTQLAPCTAAGAAADPHAGHTMPPPTTRPTEVAPKPAVPHAGHKPAAPKPTAPKTGKPQTTADPHAGHAPAPKKSPPPTTQKKPAPDPQAGHKPDTPAKPAEKQMDPVTGLMVDAATAPKTTYQGQTYYFSSEASRKEFLENPAKFARKPKR